MSISTNVGGGNVTTTIVRVVPTAKAQQFLVDFIDGLYASGWHGYPRNGNGQPVDPATLNNQARLNLLEAYMVEAALKVARNHRIDTAAKAAAETASAGNDGAIGL